MLSGPGYDIFHNIIQPFHQTWHEALPLLRAGCSPQGCKRVGHGLATKQQAVQDIALTSEIQLPYLKGGIMLVS